MIPHFTNIVDLPTHLGYSLSKMNWDSLEPAYGWGDEDEVVKFLNYKDRNKAYGGNVYSLSDGFKNKTSSGKYPLIWLVEPQEGVYRDGRHYFDGTQIIIAENTKAELLNLERWKSNIPTVQLIADKVLEHLKRGVVRRVDRLNGYSYHNRPFASYNDADKVETQDYWDAFVINVDLVADSACVQQDYLEKFCINFKKC